MIIIDDKKGINDYFSTTSLRSKRFYKIMPKKDDEFPIDDKYDQNYMNLIPENLGNLESNNDLTRAMSIVELTKILRCTSSEFQNFFPTDSINLILNSLTLEIPNLSLLVLEFLAYLTYFYDTYSSEILTDAFLNFVLEFLQYIDSESSFSAWCTLLANLFYDVPCSQLINESNLSDVLLNPPKEFVCSEYLRLIEVLCNIPDINSSISSMLIKVLIDCILGDSLIYLKSVALKKLNFLLKTETKKSVLYAIAPSLQAFTEILTHYDDSNLIINDLKLIRNLFVIDSNLQNNILDLLISNNFYTTLRIILDYDNPEVKLEVLKTINAFIKQDNLFNKEEASLFISYDFISEMNDSPFKCKIQTINLEGLLIKFYDFDFLAKFIDNGALELILEVLDTDEIYAKIICYQFFDDLMMKVSTEKDLFELFKNYLLQINPISVAENDILNENENLRQLAQIFLGFFNENNE